MKPRARRLLWVTGGLAALGAVSALTLNAFRSNVMFFVTPTQVIEGRVASGTRLRVGGLVEKGSLTRDAQGLNVRFLVTDTARDIPVTYHGVLPDLFREGKGVVAQGTLMPDGTFVADQVLAKHDENYMPPDAADAVNKARATMRVADHPPKETGR
ncbi:cytochrome c maturation protein CcmE [Paraburkholderia gardini]|uniref:Cytochrome c-type biogenesis protein CcmE n=1 Tax=Paraburkholderia gardini TaxID=2823469 RepID=A0ABM8U4M3_9BURK|nr:cytochrome c maturation protein CcmE [Paraburkholderia gardini]CAG4902446.1 Cytochrome c-type biogenesis protein CcmE [Paraburkholderia gardini]CAG4903589.1 Cytochrome c-type biogenesis protein CcmE [Paraburkholderia gardini]